MQPSPFHRPEPGPRSPDQSLQMQAIFVRLRSEIMGALRCLSAEDQTDFSGILRAARLIDPSIPDYKTRAGEHYGWEHFHRLVAILQQRVFLPNNELMRAFALPRQEPKVCFARILEESWKQELYLGMLPVWSADILVTRGESWDVGLCMGNMSFVDKAKALEDSVIFYTELLPAFRGQSAVLRMLEGELRRHNISPQTYGALWGKEKTRTLFRQYARNHAYTSHVLNQDYTSIDLAAAALSLLKDDSLLAEKIRTERDPTVRTMLAYAVQSHGGMLANALEDIQSYSQAGRGHYALITAMDHLGVASIVSGDRPFVKVSAEDGEIRGEAMLIHSLTQLGLKGFHDVAALIQRGGLKEARRLLQEAFDLDFISDDDRRKRLQP